MLIFGHKLKVGINQLCTLECTLWKPKPLVKIVTLPKIKNLYCSNKKYLMCLYEFVHFGLLWLNLTQVLLCLLVYKRLKSDATDTNK